MLVLGIDPGTAITGYGLVRETEEGLVLVDCGVITTSPDQPLPARLQVIYRGMSEIARERYGMAEADLAGRPFNTLRNYVFSQTSIMRLYEAYALRGKAGLAAITEELVKPA
ncbi:MAG: hypothetical protein GYA47_02480 [Desulfovibrio sp.]|nr:hypothetical protein [Desulfovibrio sp.]